MLSGGTITPGVYWGSTITVYGESAQNCTLLDDVGSGSIAVKIGTGTFDWVAGPGAAYGRFHASFTAAGGTIFFTNECTDTQPPDGGVGSANVFVPSGTSVSFSATPTTLTLPVVISAAQSITAVVTLSLTQQ